MVIVFLLQWGIRAAVAAVIVEHTAAFGADVLGRGRVEVLVNHASHPYSHTVTTTTAGPVASTPTA